MFRYGMFHNRISTYFRKSSMYTQQRVDLKLINNLFFIAIKTDYPRIEYQTFGLTYYSTSLHFNYFYQTNSRYPDLYHMYLQCQIDL